MGEQGIHLRKDQDLYFTIGITLEATKGKQENSQLGDQ